MRKVLAMMGMVTILSLKMVSQVYTFVKTYLRVHYKHMLFTICQFYLNKAVKSSSGDMETIYLTTSRLQREYQEDWRQFAHRFLRDSRHTGTHGERRS